jgi:deazaflavin-dependent oxidoreductase (nitroreductase family)
VAQWPIIRPDATDPPDHDGPPFRVVAARDALRLPGRRGRHRLVVVGSSGGSARDPAWVANLRADAHAILSTASGPRAVVAHEATGGERERLWSLVCEAFPLYATYQRRTARPIPLFVLEPADGG